jgi:hypothetical protein
MDWQDISILSRAYNKREHIRRLPKFSCDHQHLYERGLILGSLGRVHLCQHLISGHYNFILCGEEIL